jgi:hypothetical protein
MSYPVSPRFRVIHYALDGGTGWYLKEPQRIAFAKMPQRLKVEQTQDPKIRANGANELIHGPETGGKWKFFTGMVPLNVAGWYEGNAFEYRNGQGIRSLVLFRFTQRDAVLTVFYFTGWYQQGSEQRMQSANDFARRVENLGIPENDNGGE